MDSYIDLCIRSQKPYQPSVPKCLLSPSSRESLQCGEEVFFSSTPYSLPLRNDNSPPSPKKKKKSPHPFYSQNYGGRSHTKSPHTPSQPSLSFLPFQACKRREGSFFQRNKKKEMKRTKRSCFSRFNAIASLGGFFFFFFFSAAGEKTPSRFS